MVQYYRFFKKMKLYWILDLTDKYRTLNSAAEYTFFSGVHGTFSGIYVRP